MYVLDRGFYSITCLRLLYTHNYVCVIPIVNEARQFKRNSITAGFAG
jgi:hypothetical protein